MTKSFSPHIEPSLYTSGTFFDYSNKINEGPHDESGVVLSLRGVLLGARLPVACVDD